MPILKNRPPKYQRSGKYAVVYHNGKRIYLGDYGSPESQVAYSRFVAENQANPTFILTGKETRITVKELATAFLDHAEANSSPVYEYAKIPGIFRIYTYAYDNFVKKFQE